jgi:hypothetical protein
MRKEGRIMPLKRRLATLTAVTATLAVGPAGGLAAGAAMASPTTKATHGPIGVSFCADPNPAWGCGPGVIGIGVLA